LPLSRVRPLGRSRQKKGGDLPGPGSDTKKERAKREKSRKKGKIFLQRGHRCLEKKVKKGAKVPHEEPDDKKSVTAAPVGRCGRSEATSVGDRQKKKNPESRKKKQCLTGTPAGRISVTGWEALGLGWGKNPGPKAKGNWSSSKMRVKKRLSHGRDAPIRKSNSLSQLDRTRKGAWKRLRAFLITEELSKNSYSGAAVRREGGPSFVGGRGLGGRGPRKIRKRPKNVNWEYGSKRRASEIPKLVKKKGRNEWGRLLSPRDGEGGGEKES